MSEGRPARQQRGRRHGDEAERGPPGVRLPSDGRAGQSVSRVQHEQQLEEPQAALHPLQLASDHHATEEIRSQESIKRNREVPRGEYAAHCGGPDAHCYSCMLPD